MHCRGRATTLIRPLLRCLLLCAVTATGVRAQGAAAQAPGDPASLDSLVRRATDAYPAVRAAAARLDAARARVSPAGARPDPMLMVGVQNLPVSRPGFGDDMTMKMVGVSQVLPYPGRLGLRRTAAEREVGAAEARLRMARLEAGERLRKAYLELAYLDRALEIVERNQRLLEDFVRVAGTRYGVGTGSQSEVLQARVEVARLAETAAQLTEQHRAAAAALNEALARPSEAPVPSAVIPQRVVRAAAPASPREARFAAPGPGARAAGSPLPGLAELQAMAAESSPVIAEHDAMIQARAARLELATREHLPDFELSLQYGQRDGMPDMVSATVSVPLPVSRGRRQRQGVIEARAELAAEEAGHDQMLNSVGLDVARLHSELELSRTQLALYVGSILPQAQASLQSATASYQVGRTDLLALLEAQSTVFNYETRYHRLLADFAQKLAELERVVGREILR
jgi:outer membrane protein, heavy metal efflux system